MPGQNKTQANLRKMSAEWKTEDTDFFNTRITAIEAYIPFDCKHADAIKTIECARLARKFGFSEKGLMYLLQAESARKDFLLYDNAVKGGLFTHPPHRGFDRLSKILLEILKQLGKEATSKEILKELRRIAQARLPNSTIIEVDDNDSVYWISDSGAEKDTPFRTIENRLSKLRKEI